MKISLTKQDAVLWSSRQPEVPADLFKTGFNATIDGQAISFVPVANVKVPALTVDRKSAGRKLFTKAPYGAAIELVIE